VKQARNKKTSTECSHSYGNLKNYLREGKKQNDGYEMQGRIGAGEEWGKFDQKVLSHSYIRERSTGVLRSMVDNNSQQKGTSYFKKLEKSILKVSS
jgi:hypothetical protein